MGPSIMDNPETQTTLGIMHNSPINKTYNTKKTQKMSNMDPTMKTGSAHER
jgi:hypothetical protein